MIRGLCAMGLAQEWPFGGQQELSAVADLLAQASPVTPERLDREYHHLFIGPNKLVAPPWGSVYLDPDGVVFGDSCTQLVRWMRLNGITLHEEGTREPADHIGRMMVLLAWLCENEPTLVAEFLEQHLLTWASGYFERLDLAAEGPFYRAIAQLSAITLRDIAKDYGLDAEGICKVSATDEPAERQDAQTPDSFECFK